MRKIPLESCPESARLSTSEVVNQPDNQMATVSDSDTISYEYQLSSPKTEPDLVSMGLALRTDEQNKDSPSYMGTVTVANPDIRLASDKSKNVKKNTGSYISKPISVLLFIVPKTCRIRNNVQLYGNKGSPLFGIKLINLCAQ